MGIGTLVLPLDMTTPRDSIGISSWSYKKLAHSFVNLYVTGLKVDLNLRPVEQGLSYLTTQLPMPKVTAKSHVTCNPSKILLGRRVIS